MAEIEPVTNGAVVIVGVSHNPGMGYAVAERFAAGGMNVGIIGRNSEALANCKNSIVSAVPGADVEFVAADATDPSAVASAFATFKSCHGSPDALIYNLSPRPYPPAKVGDLTPERLEADWKTGPYAALLCVNQVLPSMKEKQCGTIIFTGASASLRGSAGFGAFGVAKAGLRSLAQSMAKELNKEGVHVAHVVIDGVVDSPNTRPWGETVMLQNPAELADAFMMLVNQPRSCWSYELMLSPCKGSVGMRM